MLFVLSGVGNTSNLLVIVFTTAAREKDAPSEHLPLFVSGGCAKHNDSSLESTDRIDSGENPVVMTVGVCGQIPTDNAGALRLITC